MKVFINRMFVNVNFQMQYDTLFLKYICEHKHTRKCRLDKNLLLDKQVTVEPRYNEVLGTMKITLLIRFLIISGYKNKEI